ncbi:MAG: hypothetical protein HOJ34_12335 [Kordiimonadaceae bacterium]|jgi:hypothetical protein|nr:hypothetical protein [Kordiimonadaceae bacterium]MBT6035716.1 hypothetical protein [Kordiimonadaceae bacterium]MBT6330559.1 hypothetical protein [Kordiimonadaceae bacterium]
MNIKRFWMAVVAAYIAMTISGIIGSMIFMDQLSSYSALGRPEEELYGMMPYMFGAYIVMTIVFVYLYVNIRKTGDIVEGAKFGALIGILVSCLTWVLYSMLPFEMPALIADNVINLSSNIVGGMVMAKVYKPA